jgi:membrane-associated phospholipid phosphatase
VKDLSDRLPTGQYLLLHLAVGLLAIVVAVMLFTTLASDIVHNRSVVQLDQNVAIAVHSWATPPVTTIMIAISLLGFPFLWAIVIGVGIWLIRTRRYIHLVTWAVAWIGGELLNVLLKNIFARPRPVFEDPLQVAANYSFPSGHAMLSVIVYGLLAYFALLGIKSQGKRIAVIVGTIILVLLIGLSRIYLGVHYFSDVVGGYAAGAAWLAVCISGMEVVRARIPIREPQPT